jgi:hypothetical protein
VSATKYWAHKAKTTDRNNQIIKIFYFLRRHFLALKVADVLQRSIGADILSTAGAPGGTGGGVDEGKMIPTVENDGGGARDVEVRGPAIGIFDSEYHPGKVRSKKPLAPQSLYFSCGEIGRRCQEALRDAVGLA